MANLSKTRAPFAFTSPRTIEKIIPEIKILIETLGGQVWDTDTQEEFFRILFDSEFYEGSRMPKNIAFAARDRITRAPKALGFVDLKPSVQLTKVGEHLVYGNRPHETITRQLLKFQLPSPYHKIPEDRGFNVRPYLELLRLIATVGVVSKIEIALFFMHMNHYSKFEMVVKKILSFREKRREIGGNWKVYVNNAFQEEIEEIYSEEIARGELKTRESIDQSLSKFIKTKRRNHLDYADAYLRYLRATQLISFERRGLKAFISDFRKEEVDTILRTVKREAVEFSTEQNFKSYLFDPYSIELPFDNRGMLVEKLNTYEVAFDEGLEIEDLKNLLDEVEEEVKTEKIQETSKKLKGYKEYDDVIDIFNSIKETPDPPLYLEWNVWRSLVMVNYAKSVVGNFSVDIDGAPLSTAGGNMPDLEVEYDDFKLIVEVTLSSGQRQYEMEGEPVPRHLGKVQSSSEKPVYCLFIAPKVSEGTLAHFFNLNRFFTKAYGGKTRIIPMSLSQFVHFVTVAKEKSFNDSSVMKKYFDTLIAYNQDTEIHEEIWYSHIGTSIGEWVN